MNQLDRLEIKPFVSDKLSLIPLELSGAYLQLLGLNGRFREHYRECEISAFNDQEAIISFLKEIETELSDQTARSYRKEIERFYMWCLNVNGKALSDMDRGDFDSYRNFLKSVPPSWCGPRVAKWINDDTLNPRWRPFVSSLPAKSIDQAETIINSLLNWLVDVGYLSANVNKGRKKKRLSRKRTANKTRNMTHQDYLLIVDLLEEVQDGAQRERWLFMVKMLFNLGARIFEISAAKMSDIKITIIDGEEIWSLPIVGKGDKPDELPLSDEAVNALRRYRVYLGLSVTPSSNEETKFFLNESGTSGISERHANRVLKSMGKNLIIILIERGELTDHIEYVLDNISCHWFRHALTRSLLDSGASPHLAKDILRHEHLDTTLGYDNRMLREKKHAIDALMEISNQV